MKELSPRTVYDEDIEDGAHDVVEAVASWGAAVFSLALGEHFAQDGFQAGSRLGREIRWIEIRWIKLSLAHTPILPHSSSRTASVIANPLDVLW